MVNGSSAGQLTARLNTTLTRTLDRPKSRLMPPEHAVSGWRRVMLLTFSAIFFGLGVLLPGVPATPFLRLTSYSLVRSSPRLNARLLRSRVFGKIFVHGGVWMHARCKAIAAMVIAVAASVYLTGYSFPATLTVVLLAMMGIAVVSKLPAARDP